MANTYSQIYIQIVFAVEGRQNLIPAEHREELHKYITGIVENRGQKMLAVYCRPDHGHVFVGMKPSISISDLTRDIKAGSSRFIDEKGWVKGRFQWQEGFGAFSYSRSQVEAVSKYVLNQEHHHKKKTFKREYIGLLDRFEVEYEDRYLFDWID